MDSYPSSSMYNLEIRALSAESLSVGRKPVKKNTYVVLRTDTHIQQNTSIDTEGGSQPIWNEKLKICMPMHAKFLTIEVHQSKKSTTYAGSRKMIGMAKIPVSDFFGGYMPFNFLHCLSYRLRDQYGDRNGIINFSLKVLSGSVPDINGNVQQQWRPRNPAVSIERLQYCNSNTAPDHIVTGYPAAWSCNLRA